MFSLSMLTKYLNERIYDLNFDLSQFKDLRKKALDCDDMADFEYCCDQMKRIKSELEFCRYLLWKIGKGYFNEQEEKE